MVYLIISVILIILLLLYFKVAEYYKIVDTPNQRSSHTTITLRGGGVIFWFAAVALFTLNIKEYAYFFTGITLVSFVSFFDDIKSLPNKFRAIVQMLALSIVFYGLDLFKTLPWWLIICIYILCVGIINAYNFMDGINGITGLYTIVVFFSFYLANTYIISFISSETLIIPIIASLIFLFYNFRKKALCFSGDVGSISIAFWIIYVLIIICLKTNSIIWILFLAVYGIETICTIIHRAYLKQNIFEAHRLHLYQLISNEFHIDQRLVSILYSFIQLLVSLSIIILYNNVETTYIFLIIIISLLISYLILRYSIYMKYIKYK